MAVFWLVERPPKWKMEFQGWELTATAVFLGKLDHDFGLYQIRIVAIPTVSIEFVGLRQDPLSINRRV